MRWFPSVKLKNESETRRAIDAVPAEVRKCILKLPCFIRFNPHVLYEINVKGGQYD